MTIQIEAADVVGALMRAKSSAEQAIATRKLNAYIEQQEKKGHARVRTHAAIKAVITRKQREDKE